jgi:hypothetical protein
MREKIMAALGTSLVIAVIITLIIYLASPSIIGYGEIITIVIATTIIVFAIYIIWDHARNMSKGLPVKDERLENINYKAGYYGFIAAIWTAVGAPAFSDILFDHELEGHIITALVVIISGVVFVASYLYLMRKGS